MKQALRIVMLLLCPIALVCQEKGGEEIPRLKSFNKVATPRPFSCIGESHYNKSGTTTNYIDSVPTRVWASKMSLYTHPSATLCTLWTVSIDFRWVPDSPGNQDTLHIFMRETTPPYTEFYHSKYLVSLGNNKGQIEVDPPVPPFSRPIITPARDVFVGLYITGTYGSDVTWHFKSPGLSHTPPRSWVFTTPTTPVPASSVIGTNDDWILECIFCYPYIPIELSMFMGSYSNDNIDLEWRTETETNNHHFDIQRAESTNGPWITRGFVNGNGNSTQARFYSFTDPVEKDKHSTASSYWYRLRQVDFDGSTHEHEAIKINIIKPDVHGFKLHTAFPNPVTQGNVTTVSYEIPDQTPVSISIYDAIGKHVETLVDHVMPAGYHEALWYTGSSIRPLEKGTYFIVMKSNYFIETQKITLLN
jgi:hypothetical protein